MKERVAFAGKLYVKHLVQWDWSGWLLSLFNFALISLVMLGFLREHGASTTEYDQLARALSMLADGLFAFPFVAIGFGLVFAWTLREVGIVDEDTDELWPEVRL